MTWGVPVSLRGKSGQLLKPKPVNNARFDKLGAFWKRWAEDPHQRCLIPTTRYAEAAGPKGAMTETWLSLTDQPLFAWAGLWRQSDEWGDCFTGVMTDNAPELAHIHDRSPVILDPEDWDTWLSAPLPDLYQFDRPYPPSRIAVDETDTPWFRGRS
jgi:putative SOS response-associated peptidase YedK